MFRLGKVTCAFCKIRVSRREARQARDGTRAVCDAAVRGMQDVGLFVDRTGLGHADCGGARVLRA